MMFSMDACTESSAIISVASFIYGIQIFARQQYFLTQLLQELGSISSIHRVLFFPERILGKKRIKENNQISDATIWKRLEVPEFV